MASNSSTTKALHCSSLLTSTSSLSFLDIPPELRNRIYDYVLTDASENVTISLMAGTDARWYEQRRKYRWRRTGMETLPTPLALIVTCKQVYNEARLMLYHKLPFFIGEIPIIPREPGVEDNKVAANMKYRQAVFKELTDGKIAIGLRTMQQIQHLEFAIAKEFFSLLTFKTNMDEEFGSAGQANHNLMRELFSGVRRVTLHTRLFRIFTDPLKFGIETRYYRSWRVGRLRDILPKLEEIVVKGPGWGETTIVTDETIGRVE